MHAPRIKKFLFLLIGLLVLVGIGSITTKYYSYIFSKRVTGEVINIERVTQTDALITTGRNTILDPAQLFSFAVAIRDAKGQIHTASSEDRQWAVVEKGKCADARFFPYPFWEFDKAGTYFGARLLELYDCDSKNR